MNAINHLTEVSIWSGQRPMTNFGMQTVAGRTNPTDARGCGRLANSLVGGELVDPGALAEHAGHGQFGVQDDQVGGTTNFQPAIRQP